MPLPIGIKIEPEMYTEPEMDVQTEPAENVQPDRESDASESDADIHANSVQGDIAENIAPDRAATYVNFVLFHFGSCVW